MKKAIAITALLSLVLLACGGASDGDAKGSGFDKKRSALVKGGKKAKGEAAAEVDEGAETADEAFAVADEPYAYDPKGKRDPFQSYILERDAVARASRGPLEQFELAQLELSAVIWDTNNERALIHDPSGRGYIVGTGTPIGKNSGTVIAIGDSSVVVEEIYENHLGERTRKNIEMRIRKSQGG
ncbi:MAG: pilus assembly protein PilP [Deltaproteobacteria bacterium]|nr:MAG: pilus assembly protein PilP [Deltaproteobacteria bacterium]